MDKDPEDDASQMGRDNSRGPSTSNSDTQSAANSVMNSSERAVKAVAVSQPEIKVEPETDEDMETIEARPVYNDLDVEQKLDEILPIAKEVRHWLSKFEDEKEAWGDLRKYLDNRVPSRRRPDGISTPVLSAALNKFDRLSGRSRTRDRVTKARNGRGGGTRLTASTSSDCEVKAEVRVKDVVPAEELPVAGRVKTDNSL